MIGVDSVEDLGNGEADDASDCSADRDGEIGLYWVGGVFHRGLDFCAFAFSFDDCVGHCFGLGDLALEFSLASFDGAEDFADDVF